MKIYETIVIKESVEINATPHQIFSFFMSIVDDESYKKWHQKNHVSLKWFQGTPRKEGSVLYAEEYIHGKLHKLKFIIKKVVPDREIVYVPYSRLLRFYFPGNSFLIEPVEDHSRLIASAELKIGILAKLLAGKRIEIALKSVRKHIREELENIKKQLEEHDL